MQVHVLKSKATGIYWVNLGHIFSMLLIGLKNDRDDPDYNHIYLITFKVIQGQKVNLGPNFQLALIDSNLT